MIETLFLLGFFVWYILALVISVKVGKKRKIGEEWSFISSFILGPVIGLGLSLMSKKN